MYFPEETLLSTGLTASSGISHFLPSFIAPGIFPLLHKSLIVRFERFHSIANCSLDFIKSIISFETRISYPAQSIHYFERNINYILAFCPNCIIMLETCVNPIRLQFRDFTQKMGRNSSGGRVLCADRSGAKTWTLGSGIASVQ